MLDEISTLGGKKMKLLIRFENLFLLIAAIYIYFFIFQFPALVLLIFFFVIDISMLGYLINDQIGAYIYNFAHSLIVPCVFLAFGLYFQENFFICTSLILFIHIFMDRFFGYGLKYSDDFKHTHII